VCGGGQSRNDGVVSSPSPLMYETGQVLASLRGTASTLSRACASPFLCMAVSCVQIGPLRFDRGVPSCCGNLPGAIVTVVRNTPRQGGREDPGMGRVDSVIPRFVGKADLFRRGSSCVWWVSCRTFTLQERCG
jgi:hypothetical protein